MPQVRGSRSRPFVRPSPASRSCRSLSRQDTRNLIGTAPSKDGGVLEIQNHADFDTKIDMPRSSRHAAARDVRPAHARGRTTRAHRPRRRTLRTDSTGVAGAVAGTAPGGKGRREKAAGRCPVRPGTGRDRASAVATGPARKRLGPIRESDEKMAAAAIGGRPPHGVPAVGNGGSRSERVVEVNCAVARAFTRSGKMCLAGQADRAQRDLALLNLRN